MNQDPMQSFKETLDQCHDWPCAYVFKFIVAKDVRPQVEDLFAEYADASLESRKSSGGKYVSVTAEIRASSSEEVMDIYRRAHEIEGIISL